MPGKKYIISLSAEERTVLKRLSCSNRRSVREKTRARILLLADVSLDHEQGASRTDAEIGQQLRCGRATIVRVRERAIERGAVASLLRQEQKHRKARVLDGSQEAHLVALTCSAPPEGQSRWSLRLLRERLIELEVVESIGLETIRTTLKKTPSSPG